MIANMHENTQQPPRLRLDIHVGNLVDLPAFSTLPREDVNMMYAAVKAAGFSGIQDGDPARCAAHGLAFTASGRVHAIGDADRVAAGARAQGAECVTVHVGRGLEADAEIDVLVAAILAASARQGIPIYIETHRATITQDMWRTLQITQRFPDVRFNGDFSHWYTGLELVYGDLEQKWVALAPVFERVRFLHGRIGSPGCIQVPIGLDQEEQPFVVHFQEMWTRSFVGFLRTAVPGDVICFTPELLGPKNFYAQMLRAPDGTLQEASDRWQQALHLGALAQTSFREAQRRLGGT